MSAFWKPCETQLFFLLYYIGIISLYIISNLVLKGEVGDNEPSHNGLKHLSFREEFLRMEVTGDDEPSMLKGDSAPLSLTGASVSITPDLEVVSKGIGI